MEEKAPIPSRDESKARARGTQAWTNALTGEQYETEQGVYIRVEIALRGGRLHGDAKFIPSDEKKNSPMGEEDGRGSTTTTKMMKAGRGNNVGII